MDITLTLEESTKTVLWETWNADRGPLRVGYIRRVADGWSAYRTGRANALALQVTKEEAIAALTN